MFSNFQLQGYYRVLEFSNRKMRIDSRICMGMAGKFENIHTPHHIGKREVNTHHFPLYIRPDSLFQKQKCEYPINPLSKRPGTSLTCEIRCTQF